MRLRDFDNPELTLEDMFGYWPETAAVFFEHKLLCVGCPIAPFHKLADACDVYDLDLDTFRSVLRKAAGAAVPDITPHPRSKPSDADPSR